MNHTLFHKSKISFHKKHIKTKMKKVTEKAKAEARKAGKLPKAPRKPKQSASISALESYKRRHDEYVRKINELAAKARKKESLKKSIFG